MDVDWFRMVELRPDPLFLLILDFLLEVSSELSPDLHVFGGTKIQPCIVVVSKIPQSPSQPFPILRVIPLEKVILGPDDHGVER